MHDLVVTCRMIWDVQPTEEARLIRRQRMNVLSTFNASKDKLTRNPAATEEDVVTLDQLIGWAERKLGWLPVDEEERKEHRRREKTRERVRRYRERKRAEENGTGSSDSQ
ncbi:MAG: hypothetical protein ABW003_15065 [Microvirga sp.]